MGNVAKILLLVAMEAEAHPIVEDLKLQKDSPSLIAEPAPTVTFSGEVDGVQVYLACNGKCLVHGVDNVGTVPAALTAYLAIQALKPDLVISLGTAGGFKAKGGEIGDVYISTGFANHDRHIPIPGFDKYGIWKHAAHPSPNLQRELGLKAGVVSSSNNLGYSEQDWKQIEENDTSVKEMEGAAIAWAAHLFGTPLLALKSVTDIVDGDRPPHEEFLENLQLAANALKDALPGVLKFVAGKDVDDL